MNRSRRILNMVLKPQDKDTGTEQTNELVTSNEDFSDFDDDDDDSIKDGDYHPPESETDDNLNLIVGVDLLISQDDRNTQDDNLPFSIIEDNNTEVFIKGIIYDIVNEVMASVEKKKNLTKKGEVRQRKKYNTSLTERKRIKRSYTVENHGVKENCSEKCKKKCTLNININRQKEINEQYWQMDTDQDRKTFIYHKTERSNPKRRTVLASSSRRNSSVIYYLVYENGKTHAVCKKFFLATIGYELKNDRILRNVLNNDPTSLTPKTDNRGKHMKENKFDVTMIQQHIDSFKPSISHYRREHAPLRLYLPSDVTIKAMFQDFKAKYNFPISYELYRKEVSKKNISFASLGNEECFLCESFILHGKSTGHTKQNINRDCEECKSWELHHEKYVAARDEYKKDSLKDDGLYFSADLQKVIMLPRCDMFKEVIFIPRIVAYNETFVPIGKSTEKPYAFVWHEAVSGRSKHDIISTFFNFFLALRDADSITIWLDNCSAQNKNWALYSFFIYLLNSDLVQLKCLDIKYFQSGHTFMSSDSFHHQVELNLKRQKKVYDFQDFVECVKKSNSKRVNVQQMHLENFYTYIDYTSSTKLRKLNPRIYLQDIVWARFERGSRDLKYKTSFENDFNCLNFVMSKYEKAGQLLAPTQKPHENGISKVRKTNIIQKLQAIIPENRLPFWKNLPETEEDNVTEDDV